MKVSVVCASYQRGPYLDNALFTYSQQTLPREEWEYIFVDDMSTDETKIVVEKWQKKGLPIRYFTAEELGHPKVPGVWRDGCKLRNAGSTHAFGEVIVSTHPEIMIPPDALEVMYNTSKLYPDAWITGIPYWMPEGKLPTGWKKDLNAIQKMKGFWDPSWPDPLHSPGAVDYRNQNQQIRSTWESEVFWGMSMAKWRWMGGFHEFDVWGSVDIDFLNRRSMCAIRTVIAQSVYSDHKSSYLMVYHQWHTSKRDMDATMEALKGLSYSNVEQARKSGGLYPIYNHGHRERTTDGGLAGILGDHQARYRFASQFAHDKAILDIPCGTGYGAMYLAPIAKGYTGIDIDAESIEWACQHYNYANALWMIKPMQNFADFFRGLDMIVSFEGLEHISYADQHRFVDEMYRALRPGGSIIVSTPQKGAAAGTPWDRYMLDAQALLSLFGDGRWEGIDLFYQLSYGNDVSPVFSNRWEAPDYKIQIPTHAQIMILGATRK